MDENSDYQKRMKVKARRLLNENVSRKDTETQFIGCLLIFVSFLWLIGAVIIVIFAT